MKKIMLSLVVVVSASILQCCSTDDPISDYTTNNNAIYSGDNNNSNSGSFNGGGSSASTDLLTFSVAIDKTTAEPSATVAEYFPDSEDNLANNTFTTEIPIDLSSPTAKTYDNGVTVSVSGGHVTANHGSVKSVCYVVSGTTANGSFTVVGDKKYEVQLNSVSITNPDSAALNLLSGKRAYVVLNGASTLTDGTTSKNDHKGALYCKGKLLLNGNGTLEVYGNYNNAIHCADYIVTRTGMNIYAKSTANHGIKANDGIYINGGVLNVEVTADGAKGINCESNITVNGGRTTVIATGGGVYEDSEAKGAAAMKCDSVYTQNGGEVCLKATGNGGKGLDADWECYVNGGSMKVITTGGTYSYSRDTASPKGIKIGTKNTHGVLDISGGNVAVYCSGSEGIESKGTIDISGGTVSSVSGDDAINSASTFTVSGGMVMGYSTGNDGMDANGNMYIKGGTVYAIGKTSPELGIDANTEGGYKLYVQGGTIVAVGGLESGASLSQACYQSSAWSQNTWYALYNDGQLALAFQTPASGGTPLVVSTSGTPTLTQGVSVSGGTSACFGMAYTGSTVSGGTSVSLSSYSGGGGMGGGMNGGMGGGPGGRW